MKDGCLHCVLVRAAEKWRKTHHASDEEIREMVGQATADIMQHEIIILGIAYKHAGERLH